MITKLTTTSLLLFSIISGIICLNLAASESPAVFDDGRAISITPFDLKLIGANFYMSDFIRVKQRHRKTPEEIFRLATRLRYKNDKSADRWQTPEETIRLGGGDCEDIALWLYTELRRNGYDGARLVVGKFHEIKPNWHAWVTLRDNTNELFILDPVLRPQIRRRNALDPSLYRAHFSYDSHFRYSHI